MGKMHEQLMKKQIITNLIKEQAKAIKKKAQATVNLLDSYGYKLEVSEINDKHLMIYIQTEAFRAAFNHMMLNHRIEELNKEEQRSLVHEHTKKHSIRIDTNSFRLEKNKINWTGCHKEDLSEFLDQIIEVNIKPLQEKEQFEQLFKPSTKTKELCL